MKKVLNPTKDVSFRTRDAKGIFVKMFGERTKICATCDAMFTPPKKNFSRAKFCSFSCSSKDMIGRVSPHKGMKHSENARRKISEANSGSKAHQWNPNRTKVRDDKLLRDGMDWKNWREKVFQRDNYLCQECEVGGYLEPHHIIPLRVDPTKRYEVENGISLCSPCHRKTFRKEELFAERYTKLISLTPSHYISKAIL